MPNRMDRIRTAAQLIREGLQGSVRAARPFSDYPAELQAAVNAYDQARRTSHGRYSEPPMSEANKATIAPMIMAAVLAYAEAIAEERAA